MADGQLRRVGAVSRLAAALATTVALGRGALATVIPGGGQGKSDCYVVLDVAGTRALRSARILECPDGDPSCDLDGLCNDQCLFGLRVCINQPGSAECTPPAALDRLRLRYRPPNVTLRPPAVLRGPVCSDEVEAGVAIVQVRQPKVACIGDVCSGKKRPGHARATASATAVSGTKPRFDRDTYILRCLPRIPSCPATTTTTSMTSTTSLPPTTTTTSTTSTTSTTTTTTSTTSTTLCQSTLFTFFVNSTIGGVFDPAVWEANVTTQGTAACNVTVQTPSGNISNVFGDKWQIIGIKGFSNCVFSGNCDSNLGTCTNCTGVDPPDFCPPLAFADCTDNRPSCTTALNGNARAEAHVLCIP